jgi:sensor c-di-GMP phosphodiesterase-like protein
MIFFRNKHLVRKIVLVLVLAVSASIGMTIYILYLSSIDQLGIRLHDFAHTEAHFIENIAALNEQNTPK